MLETQLQVQEAALRRSITDVAHADKRSLALLMLAHSADVLENAFAPLSDEDYELATRRVRSLLDLDFEAEAMRPDACEIMWAVFAAFTK